ncbi:DUF3265 domain-containing protein [Vibrio alginolyticus]|nr:DUF3265 domain-containing protein [Vibrio alginolyticus]
MRNAWHFHYALVLVFKVVCGDFGIALLRELNEELNVIPTEYKYLCSLYHPTKELQLIHYFIVTSWAGDITAHEADEVKWYSLQANQVGIAADSIALKELERVSRYL